MIILLATFTVIPLEQAWIQIQLVLTCVGMLAWIQSWLRLLWVGMWQWCEGLASRNITDRV